MKRLSIGIIEILANSPADTMYSRIMRVNSASIMPQVIAVWLEEKGHDVFLTHYSGYKCLYDELPRDLDFIFISAFTTSAYVAYALSNFYRSKGIPTALGGPHARSYPEDSIQYFDYVFGFTDQDLIEAVVAERHLCKANECGVYVTAPRHPQDLPGARERWPHIERMLKKAPFLKVVPMIASLGCPYTCAFCIDSVVPYQPLAYEKIQADLRFLQTKLHRPVVGWHDPNFGIRFNEYLGAIEEAVPAGSVRFIAESSLSLLNEENVKRLAKNGFRVMLPGIESWFDLGIKSRMKKMIGMEKVERVAEQINMIQRYIPYVQANFVFGLDSDEGPGPFELTKEFVDRCPGVFPTYNLLTAYGRSVPLNLQYQTDNRMIPIPFPLLNNDRAMNVYPLNYEWTEFFSHLLDLFEYTFSRKAVLRRFSSNCGMSIKMMNYFRANTQGKRHITYYRKILGLLENDAAFKAFFDQETTEVPSYFRNKILKSLGPLAQWFPKAALQHDAYAYRHTVDSGTDKEFMPAV